jgi:transitional endoplasmic reticulum ATPase
VPGEKGKAALKRLAGKDGSGKEIVLRVAESHMKDVGRGIARIDPVDLERIGAEIGELISITGKRQSVVKAMPAYLSDRGKGIIQIDGIARENVQAGLDEKVTVAKVAHELARTVVIAPVSPMRSPAGSQHTTYVARLLEGRGLTAGDRVRVNLFGARPQDFTVVETAPKGAVLVQATTTVRIRGDGHAEGEQAALSYEDVGGLGKEIHRIREMIELPLKYPEVFQRLGIDAPKGVLLHGPPGCGKTLIARAVAYETSAHFIHVAGPEIIHKFYGESEAHLRTVFQDAAEHAPSIVFLDEIDAIAPKREEVHGEVEKRVVAQLLALMDGLKSRGEVIVIGATNIPNSLDPALRRPGRFDREIAISIPDKNGRLEILEIHTRGMPLASDVDLERLSQITHGFVGADLEALCREAAMITLRRIMPTIDFETASIPYEKLQELEVTQDCFLEALREVEPSAIREVFTEIPDVKWSDVGGLDRVKRALMETVEWPLRHGRLFEHARLIPAKGILLYGAPGTGKTLIAKAVASESEVNFISVKGPALLSKYVGESEKGVREVFKKAKQAAPCVVFFDEIDALAPVRTGYDTTHVSERVVSQFLTEMDGIEEMKGVVILAATNRIDMVDPALLRAGRFDTRIELPLPDMKSRLAIFEIHTRGKPLAKDVNLKNLAKLTDRLVGADIEAICRAAGMVAVREFLERHADSDDYSGFKIAARHFEQAMTEVSAAPGG